MMKEKPLTPKEKRILEISDTFPPLGIDHDKYNKLSPRQKIIFLKKYDEKVENLKFGETLYNLKLEY